MSEPIVQSSITVDTKSAVDALNSFGKHAEEAAHGVTGSFGELSSMLGKFSLGAVVAFGAVGLALEGIHQAFEFAFESAHQFFEITEKFEKLEVQTGASMKELTKYDAAMKLAGGDVETLAGWIVKHGRALKTNSEMMVYNGIAADKASLLQMGFVDKLKAMIPVVERAEGAAKKQALVTDMLGRGAWLAWPQVKKFVAAQEEANAMMGDSVLVTEHFLEMHKETEISIGKTDLAFQHMTVTVGAASEPMVKWGREFRKNVYEAAEITALYFAQGSAAAQAAASKMMQQDDATDAAKKKRLQAQIDEAKERLYGGTEGPTQSKEDKDAAVALTQKELDEKRALSVAAAANNLALAHITAEQDNRITKEMLAKDLISIVEATELEKKARHSVFLAELADASTKAGAAGEDAVKQQEAANQMKVVRAKYWSDLAKIDDEGHLKSNSEILSRTKTAMDQELGLASDSAKKRMEILTQYRQWLDTQDGATLVEKTAATNAIINETKKQTDAVIKLHEAEAAAYFDLLRAEVAAERAKNLEDEAWGITTTAQRITREQLLLDRSKAIDLAAAQSKRESTADKLVAESEYHIAVAKIESEHAEKSRAVQATTLDKFKAGWSGMVSTLEGGLSTSFQALANKTMTWGQFAKSVFQGVGKAFIKLGADMLADFIMTEFKKMTFAKTMAMANMALNKLFNTQAKVESIQTATVQGGAAAVKGGAEGAASAAAIPVYGWIIAIAAGLAIMAGINSMLGGMSSAAGGWDRVPNDQFAQIHKDEMVLPAHLAEDVRQMSGKGGGSGEQHITYQIQAIDAKGVKDFLRTYGGAVSDSVASSARNFRNRG